MVQIVLMVMHNETGRMLTRKVEWPVVPRIGEFVQWAESEPSVRIYDVSHELESNPPRIVVGLADDDDNSPLIQSVEKKGGWTAE